MLIVFFPSSPFRFEQERGFKGADKSVSREGPVQFQREEDPFGLSDIHDFFKDVRQGGAAGSAPTANPSSGSSKRSNTDDRGERTSEKRRKK